jgi:hypothetical protein
VWCGARNGRRVTRPSGGRSPATLQIRLTSIASASVSGGRIASGTFWLAIPRDPPRGRQRGRRTGGSASITRNASGSPTIQSAPRFEPTHLGWCPCAAPPAAEGGFGQDRWRPGGSGRASSSRPPNHCPSSSTPRSIALTGPDTRPKPIPSLRDCLARQLRTPGAGGGSGGPRRGTGAARVSAGSGFGSIADRQRARGVSTPWYASNGRRGGDTRVRVRGAGAAAADEDMTGKRPSVAGGEKPSSSRVVGSVVT